MEILKRAYLTCSGCKWLISLIASDSEGHVSCLCTIVWGASENESERFLTTSQDQILLQTKPIEILDILWG